MAFWSAGMDVFGSFHVSTSPNAEGRRLRFSLSVNGRVIEIVEGLEAGSFDSTSVSFDLAQRVEVDSPRLTGTLRCEPRYAVANYSDMLLGTVDTDARVQHWQQAGSFTGAFTLDGRSLDFDAVGLRDRTSGPRDESVGLAETIALLGMFEDCAFTVMRMKPTAGEDRCEGFIMHEHDVERLDSIAQIVRDASGLFAGCDVRVSSGGAVTIRNTYRAGGFWVPMGWERKGPVYSCYDEFVQVTTSDGRHGAAMVSQGFLRQLV
jgi:hypothetical protein